MSRKHIQKILKEDIEDEPTNEIKNIDEFDFRGNTTESCWDILAEDSEEEEEEEKEEEKEEEEIEEQKEKMKKKEEEKQQATQQTKTNKRKKNKQKKKKKNNHNNKKGKKKNTKNKDLDKVLAFINGEELEEENKEDSINKKEEEKIEKIEKKIELNPLIKPFDIQKMNPKYEFKSMFGDIDAMALTSGSKKNGQKKTKVRSNIYVNPNTFVTPGDNWPKFKNYGLSIKLVRVDDEGVEYYMVNQARQYVNISKKYQIALHSHDPNSLFMLYRLHPYHIPTLVQISEILKMQQNLNEANSFLEQAIYTMERILPSSLVKDIKKQKARLIHTEPNEIEPHIYPNIMIYYILVKRIHMCTQQGTHQTALELAKFLLAMNPSDPCGMLLQLDYLMLQSGKYNALIKYYQENIDVLRHLPNWNFSVALATYFLMEEQRAEMQHSTSISIKNILSDEDCRIQFQKAFHQYPQLLPILIKQLKWDITKWEPKIRYTDYCSVHPNESIQHLLVLYVERNASFFEKLEKYIQTEIVFVLLSQGHPGDQDEDEPVIGVHEGGEDEMVFLRYGKIKGVEITGSMLQPLLTRLHQQAIEVNHHENDLKQQINEPEESGIGQQVMDFVTTLVMPWNRASLQTPQGNDDDHQPHSDIL